MAKNCIFCALPRKMTDEHVWGDWTKEYVPRTTKKHDFANVSVPRPGEPDPPVVRIRAGDPLNSKVPVVCADCNNCWMSQLQTASKPILIPLFEGLPSILDERAQATIAAWVAMATMTGEHLADPDAKIVVSQAERDWLRKNRTAPFGWRICIGRHQRGSWLGQWVRATFPIMAHESLPDVVAEEHRRPTVQTTAFIVGKLFVWVMSGPFPEITYGWDWRTAPHAAAKLQQLWPIVRRPLSWPLSDMTDADADLIATAFVRYSDDLALRVGYR